MPRSGDALGAQLPTHCDTAEHDRPTASSLVDRKRPVEDPDLRRLALDHRHSTARGHPTSAHAGSRARCWAFQLVIVDRPVLAHADRATVAPNALSEVRRGEATGCVQTCGVGVGECEFEACSVIEGDQAADCCGGFLWPVTDVEFVDCGDGVDLDAEECCSTVEHEHIVNEAAVGGLSRPFLGVLCADGDGEDARLPLERSASQHDADEHAGDQPDRNPEECQQRPDHSCTNQARRRCSGPTPASVRRPRGRVSVVVCRLVRRGSSGCIVRLLLAAPITLASGAVGPNLRQLPPAAARRDAGSG